MGTYMQRVPDVTVIIPCLDVVNVIPQQFFALAAQDFRGTFEVILADNGSQDLLRAEVFRWRQEFGLDLRWVDASTRKGVSHARNIGLREAAADLVAVCDADDIVSRTWLSGLVGSLRKHTLVGGAVDVRLLNDHVLRTWRPGPPVDRLPDKFEFLPYAMGANVGVRRDAALAVGGWDETYVAGGDDVDFSWRLQLAGARLGYSPQAVVHYRYRTDLPGAARQAKGYSMCEARLLHQFAVHGAKPYPSSKTRSEVLWLAQRCVNLVRSRAKRGQWIYRAATVVGRLMGVVKYRCWVG